MKYDVQRWDSPDYDVELDPLDDGLWVLAADAEAHEKAAVEAAVEKTIRDCLAAVEGIPDWPETSADWHRDYDEDPTGGTRNPRIWVREATTALRALLEGDQR